MSKSDTWQARALALSIIKNKLTLWKSYQFRFRVAKKHPFEALRKPMKCIKVLKILWIACLCTLDEFSDEWNAEELLKSLLNLLTLLLNLFLFDFSEPFIAF